jgi:CheY-like chemotaxis protein
LRVLLVDDDPHFRLFVQRALEKAGHEVTTLDTPFGLVNRVAGRDVAGQAVEQPELVVLDHMMPGLQGRDLLGLLANNPRTRDIPILFVSAAAHDDLRAAASAHPCCLFVEKTGRVGPVLEGVDALVSRVKVAAERSS